MKSELLCVAAALVVGVATATDMDNKARTIAGVVAPRAGVVEVTCNDPGGWKFDVKESDDAGRDVVTVRLASPTNATPPRFGVLLPNSFCDWEIWRGKNSSDLLRIVLTNGPYLLGWQFAEHMILLATSLLKRCVRHM